MQALQADAVLLARNMCMSYAQPWLIRKPSHQGKQVPCMLLQVHGHAVG
jgi:hypothetical protein